MTLSTWKTEFYPTEASECSKEDAIEHSLRKWRGLRKEALERHGAFIKYGDVRSDGEFFVIGGSSCALCESFFTERACKACPLAMSRGGKPCDREMPNEAISPWHSWTDRFDPEPMISALEKAQKEQQ